MRTIDLNGEWILEAVAPSGERQAISCTVPGNIELALFDAGIIGDPYFGENARQLRQFEFYDWIFRREFEFETATDAMELVFDGLDTCAEIKLNGHGLGTVENAFIRHRFDVGELLQPGANILEVTIHSAVKAMRRYHLEPSEYSAYPYNIESLFIRKPAHAWGWDIAPRMALGGIWRGVRIEELPPVRFLDVVFTAFDAAPDRARLGVHYNFAADTPDYDGMEIEISGRCEDSEIYHRSDVWLTCGFMYLEVHEPKLWQPRNYGKPHLYDMRICLLCKGHVLTEKTCRIGIRTVELKRREISSAGQENDFVFIVNNREIYVQGTNHVPIDAMHSRDASRLPQFLKLVDDLNCNMLRVWGGGVYEDEEFYNFCDEHGIMVWQDFMMGCAAYPQSDDFQQKITAEIQAVVRALRHHPSLVLWAGDNECDMLTLHSGLPVDPTANRITRETIPQVLRRLDPGRPYLPSSPYISPEILHTVKADNREPCPENHLWGPRAYFKSDCYGKPETSFISEIGYHGCPAAASIKTFLPESQWWPWQDNQGWNYHASNPWLGSNNAQNYRTGLMANQIREMFGFIPETMEDFIAASQICQAEAKKFFVETARLGRPRITGILWWNLLDCWPQFSDAVVDYYFRKKLAYHYLRRLQQPGCLMLTEPAGWSRTIKFDNASSRELAGKWRVRDVESGKELAAGFFRAAPNQLLELDHLPASVSEQRLILLDWQIDGERYSNHFVTGAPPFDLEHYRRCWLPVIAALEKPFDTDNCLIQG